MAIKKKSTIKKAKAFIRGTRPLIWHAFTEEALSLERKVTDGKAGNNPQEWKDTVLVDPQGKLYIKPTYVFGAMREGALYTKVGRGTIQKKVMATLIVMDNIVYIENRHMPLEEELTRDITKPVYLDVCSVRNPNTKGRNICYRIASSIGWEAHFTIQWDSSIVSENQIENVVTDAGVLVGLGDGRSIGNGRFEVTSFEILKK